MKSSPLSPLGCFVRQHDPDRFLCALFAPAERREALFALLAYNHELARAREVASQPMMALIRLQWWREVVENAVEGRPPRHHEVAAPLHDHIISGTLQAEDLLAMADAREAEAEESIPTAVAFDAYLRGTAGGLSLAIARLLGVPGTKLADMLHLGTLCGLAGVLRNTVVLAAQGRCLLPEDRLTAAGLTPQEVIAQPARAAPVARAMAEAGLRRVPTIGRQTRETVAAGLPLVLAVRDLRRCTAGRVVPARRGFGDRLAVTWAGLTGRLEYGAST
jgi:phytoene synthase